MIEDSLSRLQQGDEVWWDLTFSPSEEGPVLVAMFWMPSGMLGTFFNHAALWTPMGHTQEAVDGSVRQALESLREVRTQALAQAQQQVQQQVVATNGSEQVGLMMPPGFQPPEG
jgi:hypothetical protein